MPFHQGLSPTVTTTLLSFVLAPLPYRTRNLSEIDFETHVATALTTLATIKPVALTANLEAFLCRVGWDRNGVFANLLYRIPKRLD